MAGSNVAEFGVGVEVVGADAHDAAFAFAALQPVWHDDWHVHVACFLPRLTASFGADEVGRVDAEGVDHLCADAVNGRLEVVAQLLRHDARGDSDARQIRHLVCAHRQALTGIGAGRSAKDEVEGVFRVDGQTGDLGAQLVARDVACFATVAVQTQTAQFCSGQLDGLPFQHH